MPRPTPRKNPPMNKMKNKFISILVIVTTLLSVVSLTSCNRSYDEEEVIENAKILLKSAEMLNFVYYGEGIRFYDSDEEIGYYRKAELNHLDELGFHTIDELKMITEKTFSDEYSSLLYSTILSPLTSDIGVVSATRYYQAYDEKTAEPTHIMVYIKFPVMFKDSIEYDYDSMRVIGAKKEKVFVKVDATVSTSDGKTQNTTVTITLVEDEDGWRIDNPTYANYNEAKDRYDELKDKDIK